MGPQLFRVAGLVEGSVEISGAGAEDARQAASFDAGWDMTISVMRPAKVLISNCSMFRTELLPISDVSRHRNICGFEVTDVSAGMSLLEALFTKSLPADSATPSQGVEGPLAVEQRQRWRAEQEARLRDFVDKMDCDALLQTGHLDRCGSGVSELLDARAKARARYLDEAVEKVTCDELLAGGFIPACGPSAGNLNGEEALARARNSLFNDMRTRLETGGGCSELLWQGMVTDCEYAQSEESDSDGDWIPDDFVEDSVPPERHEAYEKSRKEGEQAATPEALLAQTQFLESLLQGTQLAFVIKHPDKLDEDFGARVGSGPGERDGFLSDRMMERFVIEVRALPSD